MAFEKQGGDRPEDQRFRTYVSSVDDGVFIIDGDDPTSSERWLGIGFRTASTKKAREKYAQEICEILNRGVKPT